MAPIRYSLHYEDYSEHLMSRFGKLLQMQSLVDMTLMCSSHTLRVHKAVLAASSAYFQEVLQKQTGEPLIILKMRFSVLKSLVEFMYCGKTQCLEENLDELVSAAQFLKIKGLSKVTKEGLGITNTSELPVFTPPVVINRPPQSLIGLHSQDMSPRARPAPPAPHPAPHPVPHDSLIRTNSDMVVRIPFDIEKGGGAKPDYSPRAVKPRRGRPSVRHRGGGGAATAGPAGWEAGVAGGALGRAAERALLRREHDSRKAIHQLKHLQTRYNKDYMDRVTLSQAVNSICGPESAPGGYMSSMGMDQDFMYLEQPLAPSVLDHQAPYKDGDSYSAPSASANETVTSGVGSAMSQYVNALKSAGLPTDLPILFESGDGSYINVNEQVLLDMVQSNEIQYEVIEQPNIIENVADPSGIKSIDDLSKSIERGEMMINKNYTSTFNKDQSQYRHEDALNSLNAILPDNLESYAEQPNYVVLDQGNTNPIDHSNDFSCIDGDMQFFTKSMSDDVKKYYEGQQLEQLCPTSSALDTSFNMSLLKSSHLETSNLVGQYTSLNNEDLRRNEDYDFGLQLTQSTDYKDDGLDCLISIPKPIEQNKDEMYDRDAIENAAAAAKAQEEIIKDLMNIETNIQKNVDLAANDTERCDSNPIADYNQNAQDFNDVFAESSVNEDRPANNEALVDVIPSSGIQWDNMDMSKNTQETYNLDSPNDGITNLDDQEKPSETQFDDAGNFSPPAAIDLTDSMKPDKWDVMNEVLEDKENNQNTANCGEGNSNLEDDIPFAVGLQPMKPVRADENSLLKRNYGVDIDMMDDSDAKCLKRKVKYKKI